MLALTVDIGSTFTKAIVLDISQETIVARSTEPSTVERDVSVGLERALEKMDSWGSLKGRLELRLGCSSAAGGLKIAAVGLVPELTGEAARRAALGAGGKVIGVYSHRLNKDDVKRLEDSTPDLVLFSGGTDGGDEKVVSHNGSLLAQSGITCPIVVACNREVASEVEETLVRAGKTVVRTENVMPELGRLNVEPAKKIIRDLFIKHITRAKGLEKAKEFVEVLMPTPSASLSAAQLLSEGTAREPGLGDLMAVEVGGATTNVYSVFEEPNPPANIIHKGVKEGTVKRTVEGDLGVRISAPNLVEAAGEDDFGKMVAANPAKNASEMADRLANNPSTLPRTRQELQFDSALVKLAVRFAVERHVGSFEEIITPAGRYLLQMGKNFLGLRTLVGSGGPIVYNRSPSLVLDEATDKGDKPNLLKPKRPRKFVDANYVLWSAGLLASHYPDTALRLLKNSLKPV